MKILYFAWVRELVGKSEEFVEPPETVKTVSDLLGWLEKRGPGYEEAFRDKSKIRAALDQTFVAMTHPLQKAGEVALFPPVTGG